MSYTPFYHSVGERSYTPTMPRKLDVMSTSPYWVDPERMVELYCGDCRTLTPFLSIRERFDLAFLDPPFNIGQDYKEYDDRKKLEEYVQLVGEAMVVAWQSLAPTGILCLHGPDKLIEIWLMCINEHLGQEMGNSRIAWVNWHYRFGQNTRANWVDSRCHCLIYAKDVENYTWNPEDVLVQSDRVEYGDKRIHETENGGLRVPGTTWGVPSDGPYWGRVQGNNQERCKDCPNQLPELYLARLLKAYTNPGDSVLDQFGGSGTTAVVAKALNRRCSIIELGAETCQGIVERVRKGAVRV